MIVECSSCRGAHDLTGRPPGAAITCGCGTVIERAPHADAPLPCPACTTLVAPSHGQCGACAEPLFTTACAACAKILFQGHRHCVRCGVATSAPPPPDPWAEGTPVRGRRPDPTEALPWRPIWRVELTAGTPAALRGSRGACPRCRVPLARQAVGTLELDPCRGCLGVFFEAEVLAGLLIAGDRTDAAALQASCAPAAARCLPPPALTIAWCPCCAGPMRSLAIAARGRATVLVCRSHGVWVDPGELTAVLRVLTVRSQARAGDLERAAFRDQIASRRFDALLLHARALGRRGTAPRTPMGLLAELFG